MRRNVRIDLTRGGHWRRNAEQAQGVVEQPDEGSHPRGRSNSRRRRRRHPPIAAAFRWRVRVDTNSNDADVTGVNIFRIAPTLIGGNTSN